MSIFREHVVKRLTRSNGWRKVRNNHIKNYPKCAVCDKKKGLEVHHKKPFHLFPALELDPTNLVTLCRRHHFAIGHLEYWKANNIKVMETITYFRSLLLGRL